MSHLKRMTMPRAWGLPRKTSFWVTHPDPGPHSQARAIPLIMVLRDCLKLCDTAREARRIIAGGMVRIDQRVVRQPRWPVGLMDVLSLPPLKLHYRVLLDTRGLLRFVRIKSAESKWKLVRILNKTIVRGGKTQLNLHDGNNMLFDKQPVKTGDVLQVSLPAWRVKELIAFAPGAQALITGGSHVGAVTAITDIEAVRGPGPNVVRYADFETIKDYSFVIGSEKPLISLPEVKL